MKHDWRGRGSKRKTKRWRQRQGREEHLEGTHAVKQWRRRTSCGTHCFMSGMWQHHHVSRTGESVLDITSPQMACLCQRSSTVREVLPRRRGGGRRRRSSRCLQAKK